MTNFIKFAAPGFIFATVFAFTGFTLPVQAATLSVDAAAASDPACPSTGPFRTISAAIGCAQNGDIINVAAGIYSENIVINKSISLNGGTGAILNFTAAQQIGFANNPANVSITGFTINSTDGTSDIIINDDNNTCGDGASALNGLNIRNNTYNGSNRKFFFSCSNTALVGLNISGNRISNITADVAAIDIQNSRTTTVSNNTINGSGRGIQLDAIQSAVISGNNISNTVNQGIQVADTFGPSGNITISTNTITGAHSACTDLTRGAIRLYGSNFNGPVTISSNILRNSCNGIVTRPTSNDLTGKTVDILNNTISGSINAGIRHYGNGSFSRIENNTFNNPSFDIDYQSNTNQLAAWSRGWNTTIGNFYSVANPNGTDQVTRDAVEIKVRHNCADSPFFPGSCNSTVDFTTNKSVQYALAPVTPPTSTPTGPGTTIPLNPSSPAPVQPTPPTAVQTPSAPQNQTPTPTATTVTNNPATENFPVNQLVKTGSETPANTPIKYFGVEKLVRTGGENYQALIWTVITLSLLMTLTLTTLHMKKIQR